jgi:diketogulonate reductase-like aldo/keto reductase
MSEQSIDDRGAVVPPFLYGTAWKEETTGALVESAIRAGFRGIDTANQRRHYFEQAVGDAVASCCRAGIVSRDELFLQTKFTFRPGQDHRLPYDPEAPVAEQVEQSFASSLQHLQVEQVDSYLLHGPMVSRGLSDDDWEAWQAIARLHREGKARMIGVSNFTAQQLELLLDRADVAPKFVQNRCYASHGWDREVRAICRANGIIYQGFSLLTANRPTLAQGSVQRIAAHYQRTVAQIVFRFALDVGMLPLTGTTNADHMQQDLAIFDFQLAPEHLKIIETLYGQ